MNCQTLIVENVTNILKSFIDENGLNVVMGVLRAELQRYEIREQPTAIAIREKTPEDYLRKYIATKRIEGLAETTIKRYYELNMRLIQFLNYKNLDKITTDDIRFYLSVQRDQQHNANSTLDGMRRCYNAFFGWLFAERIIRNNPCSTLHQIKSKKAVRLPYSPKELEKLRESCKNIRDRALIEFLYATGCRVTEVANLNIQDVDFEKLEIIVLGKGNKERRVYMTEVAALYLSKYLESRTDSSIALFVGKNTPRLHKAGIEKIVRELAKRAGVTNAYPHRFRRTLATNLLDRGMAITDVSAILGHADLSTTQIYCHISQAKTKASYCQYSS